MTKEQMWKDIDKLDIAERGEKHVDVLGPMFFDYISDWATLMTNKEFEKEVWQFWKDVDYRIELVEGDIGVGYRKPTRKDLKDPEIMFNREEFADRYAEEKQDEYIDFIVNVYMND